MHADTNHFAVLMPISTFRVTDVALLRPGNAAVERLVHGSRRPAIPCQTNHTQKTSDSAIVMPRL